MTSLPDKLRQESAKLTQYDEDFELGSSFTDEISLLKSKYVKTLEEVEALFKSLNESNLEGIETIKTKYASTESALSEHQEELDKWVKEKSNLESQLEEKKEELAITAKEAGVLAGNAQKIVEKEESTFPYLRDKKRILFLISRITWEKVSNLGHVIKGFVVNARQNDIYPFTLDRRELNPAINASFLWEFIGSGISAAWNIL